MTTEKVGAAIRERRRHLGYSQTKLAGLAGVSSSTVESIEIGRRSELRPRTARAIEAALRWEAGSIDAVAQGGAATEMIEARTYVASEQTITPEVRALLVMLEGADDETRAEAARQAWAAASRVIYGQDDAERAP